MTLPPSELARQCAGTIAKYRMLEGGGRVLVGVSGGADSISLLLVLVELGYAAAAAHLNHGLRGSEADGDECFVADLCKRMAIPFFARRIAIAETPGNIEAAGRLARKDFFRSLAAAHGFSKIAIAHTRDDRVETCLLHLLRGAGVEGMASMAPVAGTTVRPFIETSRDGIERFLTAAGQPWRNDSTNRDPTFARNRMRHQVLPMLAELFNPRLPETLARTVELIQSEDAWMQTLTAQWLSDHGAGVPTSSAAVSAAGGEDAEGAETIVAVEALAAAPVALARRAIRTLLRQAGSDLTDVTFDHIEQVRRLAAGTSGKTIELPGQLAAEREFDRIVFRQKHGPARKFDYMLPIPGTIHIPEIGKTFRAEIAAGTADDLPALYSGDRGRVFVDGGRLGPCVKIRNWKPGDYYKPVGWPGGKLKKIFQRARVPRSQRSRWPVFATDSTVIWVASFPVSREFAPDGRSQKIVALEVLEIA